MSIFVSRPYLVYHPLSPGTKVIVFRNWIQDLWYPRYFASTYEELHFDSYHVGIDRTKEYEHENYD